MAALSASTGGPIFLQAGTYLLDHAIQVPDDTALIGEGTMLFDGSGLPTGFVSESRTVLAATAAVTGDFVTLGDGASLMVLSSRILPGPLTAVRVAVSSRNP
jgi:hypothetical protein